MVLTAAALLFYIIALGLPKWSSGTAFTQQTSGTMDVGIWKVCVSMDPSGRIFHSTGSDCRIGQCPVQSTFAVGTSWDSHGICERSKATAAFLIFALVLSFFFLWYSMGYFLRGRKPLAGWASLCGGLAGISGVIAWAVWLGWQNAMNNDDGRLNGAVTFSTLNSGPAFGLTVSASVFNIVACFQYLCGARCAPHSAPVPSESDTDLDHDDSMELGPSRWSAGTDA